MLIGKKGETKSAIEKSDASSITIRGKDLCNELMGNVSIAEFFFFHLTGKVPTKNQAFFIDLLIVALAEHGLVPSVQAARMTLAAAPEALQAGRFIPGFRHPIRHPVDPRAQRVLELADSRKASGKYVDLLKKFPPIIEEVWEKPLPMNLTGPMAAVLLDLDVPKGAVRGIPILSRTLGLIGHLNEKKERPIGFMMSHFGSDPIEYDGG